MLLFQIYHLLYIVFYLFVINILDLRVLISLKKFKSFIEN